MKPFAKALSAERARRERDGWRAVAELLPVPASLGCRSVGETVQVLYEDIFTNHRCDRLLGDCIVLADHQRGPLASVASLIAGVGDDLHACLSATGDERPLGTCVPALYTHRLRPRGRIDHWYGADEPINLGTHTLTLRELASWHLRINGVPRHLDIPALITDTRRRLDPRSRWTTAVTQGDPTEPNIAAPRTWLDFEHAGRNTLAGDLANLLWYLLGMGGWLVPRYQPEVYQRTLRFPLPPVVMPSVTFHIDHQERFLDVRYQWHSGPGRRQALHTTEQIVTNLVTRTADPPADPMDLLRPFLIVRILGVLRITRFDSDDLVLCLARLAELHDATTTLHQYLHGTEPLPSDPSSTLTLEKTS